MELAKDITSAPINGLIPNGVC